MRAESASKSKRKLQRIFSSYIKSIDCSICAYSGLWLALTEKDNDKAISPRYPELGKFFVTNHLSHLVNSALSVKELCLSGLDTQARVALRSLLESIYQTLILFYAPKEYYHRFQQGIDEKTSKSVYYELFAKKKSLHRKLEAIERQLGFPEDLILETSEWRAYALSFYSQATHSSYMSVHVGSYANTREDHLTPNLLGMASRSSRATLHDCAHELCYFNLMLSNCIHKHWRISTNISKDDLTSFANVIKHAGASLERGLSREPTPVMDEPDSPLAH